MNKRLAFTLLIGIVIVYVFSLNSWSQSSTGSGTVTLQVSELVDLTVVDGSISIQFTPSSTSGLYWFAINPNDFFSVTENDTNVDVTLAVTGFTVENLPPEYTSLISENPMLFFNISNSSTFATTLMLNATINITDAVDVTDVTIFPDTITLSSGTTLTRAPQPAVAKVFSISLAPIAVEVTYDAQQGTLSISQPGNQYYLCIGLIDYVDATGKDYLVAFASVIDTNVIPSCASFNFTKAGSDFALADLTQASSAGITTGVEDYILKTNTTLANVVISLRVYGYEKQQYSWILLRPALAVPYNAAEDTEYVWVLVRLPAAAPTGTYSFTVNLENWIAET